MATAVPLAPAAPAVTSTVPGISSFYTSNANFYRIDTAVEVPQVSAASWQLRIHGMVDHEVRLSFDDVLARTLVGEDITLTCVSNTVGGSLTGTARWLGARLKDLRRSGREPVANQLVGRSINGWTSGFPIVALDGKRPALLAIGMNGDPMPLEHRFPGSRDRLWPLWIRVSDEVDQRTRGQRKARNGEHRWRWPISSP